MYRFTKFFLLMAFTMITSTGCIFFSAPPRLYLLEPIVDNQSQRTPTQVQAIGVAVVNLPEYADTQSIATRLNDTRVVLSRHHTWAESPDTAITRVLADRIQAYTGSNVIVEPWPRGFDPEARVEFDFDKLLRDESGGVEVSGQLRIISDDGDNVLAIRSFQAVRETSDDKSEDFFRAMSLAINDIARLTTSTLLALEARN